MIKNHRAVLRTLAAAAAAVVLGTTQAQAQTTYDYSQQFGALGSVTGQFIGTDGLIDGLIDGQLDASEVSVQSMTFSGGLGSITYGAGDVSVIGFQWVLGDTGGITNPASGFDLYGDNGSGIAMNWVAGDYVGLDPAISLGIVYLSDAITGTPTGTFEATGLAMLAEAPVTPVPEPESYLMMALGLAGIFAAKRRKAI